MGLAYSNLIALSLYNISRYIFLYKKFGMQPYQLKHLMLLLVSIGLYIGIHNIPQANNIYLDIITRSSLFIVVFFPIIYFSKVAPDLMKIVSDKLSFLKRHSN